MDREPHLVYDNIDLDLLVKVANHSILNPAFSMWVPVTLLSQGYTSTSTPFLFSLVYFLVTLLVNMLSWSSLVCLNKSWKQGLAGMMSMKRINWEDEVVVITGGSNGIGKMVVETLALRHVTVVVLDIEEPDFVQDWDDVYFFRCDVSQKSEISRTAERIRKELGDPTILINNAGILNAKPILELSEEEIRRTFDVNTLAHFWTIQEFLPAMLRENKGHIVTVSSVLGCSGVARVSDYCGSKAAVMALHESLFYELKTIYNSPPIRLTLLCPGHVGTRMFQAYKPNQFARFLSPTQEPHTVAKEVISALDAGESREIFLPFYTRYTWLARGLPSWARDGLRWIMGADHGMDNAHKKDTSKDSKVLQ